MVSCTSKPRGPDKAYSLEDLPRGVEDALLACSNDTFAGIVTDAHFGIRLQVLVAVLVTINSMVCCQTYLVYCSAAGAKITHTSTRTYSSYS